MIGVEEALHVNRRSPLHPEWFTDRENPWPFHIVALYAMADQIGVLEHRSNVEDGSESPPREHLLKLCRDLP